MRPRPLIYVTCSRRTLRAVSRDHRLSSKSHLLVTKDRSPLFFLMMTQLISTWSELACRFRRGLVIGSTASASSASLLGSALRVGSGLFPLGTRFWRWAWVECMEQAHGCLGKQLHQVGIWIDCVLDGEPGGEGDGQGDGVSLLLSWGDAP